MEIEEINFEDNEYPDILRIIPNPPKKLYTIGNKAILRHKGIAIVGSRDCTLEGIKNAKYFARNVAKNGFTVISGMAKGIDAASHKGALEVSGKTIAVLGNGPDYIFPPQNENLYYEILEKGGLIVSEYIPGTMPCSNQFRERNRIVSGLSLAVLIIEAEWRSGTSITARFAREQGKEVFCIPNSIENRKGVGTNILIQKGAKLVLNPKELIEKYTEDKIVIEKREAMNDTKINNLDKVDLNNIKPEYRKIYSVLDEELMINEISLKTDIKVADLYQTLFMMEIEGLIEKEQNRYRRKKEE